MKARIKQRLVDRLKPGPADRTIFDTEVPGFALRVRKTGGISYAVEHKAGHGRRAPTRRVKFGPVGKMTPDEARAAAKRVLGSVAHGKDRPRKRPASGAPCPSATSSRLSCGSMSRRSAKPPRRRGCATRLNASSAALGSTKPDRGHTAGGRSASFVDERSAGSEGTGRRPSRVARSWAGKSSYVEEGENPARGVERFPE